MRIFKSSISISIIIIFCFIINYKSEAVLKEMFLSTGQSLNNWKNINTFLSDNKFPTIGDFHFFNFIIGINTLDYSDKTDSNCTDKDKNKNKNKNNIYYITYQFRTDIAGSSYSNILSDGQMKTTLLSYKNLSFEMKYSFYIIKKLNIFINPGCGYTWKSLLLTSGHQFDEIEDWLKSNREYFQLNSSGFLLTVKSGFEYIFPLPQKFSNEKEFVAQMYIKFYSPILWSPFNNNSQFETLSGEGFKIFRSNIDYGIDIGISIGIRNLNNSLW